MRGSQARNDGAVAGTDPSLPVRRGTMSFVNRCDSAVSTVARCETVIIPWRSYPPSVNSADALRRVVQARLDTTGGMSTANRKSASRDSSGSSHSRTGFSRVPAARSVDATGQIKSSATAAAILPASIIGSPGRSDRSRPLAFSISSTTSRSRRSGQKAPCWRFMNSARRRACSPRIEGLPSSIIWAHGYGTPIRVGKRNIRFIVRIAQA